MLEQVELYDGNVILEFDPKKHRYFYQGIPVPGVTSITDAMDKPWMGPWTANMVVEYVRECWRPGQAYDEIQIGDILEKAKGAAQAKSKRAANIGSMVHDFCEKWIKVDLEGGTPPELPVNPQARNSVGLFFDWLEEHNVEFFLSERKIFSLEDWFAGTLDAEGLVDGSLCIIDFKTSNGIYEQHMLQTAAYQKARREETRQKYYARWAVRFGKEDAQFEARPFFDFDQDFAGFLGAKAMVKRAREIRAEFMA